MAKIDNKVAKKRFIAPNSATPPLLFQMVSLPPFAESKDIQIASRNNKVTWNKFNMRSTVIYVFSTLLSKIVKSVHPYMFADVIAARKVTIFKWF